SSAGRKPGPETLPLRRAHLSGARLLGRTIRQSIQRSDFVGQVRASGGRWALWRSVCGCNRGIAADCGRGVGEVGKKEGREWQSETGKSSSQEIKDTISRHFN